MTTFVARVELDDTIAVGSLAELLAWFASPPPETAAMFVRLAGALAATLTVTVTGGYAPPATRLFERVQVRLARFEVQPEPPIAVMLRPAGKASVIVMDPEEAALPILVTMIV